MSCEIAYAGGIYYATQKLIQHSENEIIIISPWFDFEGHIKESLIRGLRKDVKVIVVTRKSNSEKHKTAISELQKFGAIIYYDELLHAKLLLSDREFAILGSANLQERAMQKNHELAVVTEDYDLIYEIIEFITYLEGVLGIEIFKHADGKFESSILKFLKRIGDKFKKVEETERNCQRCDGNLILREGKRGKFYGCSNFPKCRYTEDFLE